MVRCQDSSPEPVHRLREVNHLQLDKHTLQFIVMNMMINIVCHTHEYNYDMKLGKVLSPVVYA